MVGESESDNKVSCIPYMREQRRACVLFWARGRCRGERVQRTCLGTSRSARSSMTKA